MTQGRQLVVFFAATFTWSWGILAVLLLAPDAAARWVGALGLPEGAPFFVAVYGPSVSGVVLTAVFGGRAGLAELAGRLHPGRPGAAWYLVVILGMVALSFASGLVGALAGWTDAPSVASVVSMAAVLGTTLLSVPGPLGEELGWRGFALPRMLNRWSPLTASLLLGVVWSVFHLPAFVLAGTPQQAFNLPLFLLGAVGLSVLVTWLFVRTAGSVLMAILFHLMANGANDVTGVGFEAFAVGTLVAAVLLALFGGLRGPAPAAARADPALWTGWAGGADAPGGPTFRKESPT